MNQRNLERVFFNWITRKIKTKYRVESLHHYNQRKQTEVITVPAMCNYVRVFESFFVNHPIEAARAKMESSTPEIDQIGYGNWHWTGICLLNCRSSFGVLRHWVFQHFPLIFCCFFRFCPAGAKCCYKCQPEKRQRSEDERTLFPASRYFLCRNILMEEELHFQFFM